MNNYQTVLITGASSGLGVELAKLFAEDNFNLILLQEISQSIPKFGSLQKP